MERCRWQMSRPDDQEKVVLVNIPAQQLWAVGGDSVLNMRICCGATATKSPLLHSTISHIQVNPDWIVPHNIVKSDIARHAGDSAYFNRHHYYIVERATGDSIDPAEVTPSDLTSGTLRVGQHGGPGNSLGRIVFRFNNNFSVYLHDTNNRGAFKREKRTLSHGCIRVEKPFDLALFLLPELDEWDQDRLRLSMDLPPQTDQGKEYLEENEEEPRPLRLMTYHEVTPRVPVYIIYYTAYPNPATGIVETWPDLYGYDKAIASAIDCFLPK
jgi:murein L,D-transpeptidase YcbB/YkuD